MENAALLSSKIEETKENNEFAHKIGQQYHKPQNKNYRKKHYPQNQYQHQQRSTPNNNTQSRTRCGAKGHHAEVCRRSRGKMCNKCQKVGHFTEMYRTKLSSSPPSHSHRQQPPTQRGHHNQ